MLLFFIGGIGTVIGFGLFPEFYLRFSNRSLRLNAAEVFFVKKAQLFFQLHFAV